MSGVRTSETHHGDGDASAPHTAHSQGLSRKLSPKPPPPLTPKLELLEGTGLSELTIPTRCSLIYKLSFHLLLPLPHAICNDMFICANICLISVFHIRSPARKGTLPCPLLYA